MQHMNRVSCASTCYLPHDVWPVTYTYALLTHRRGQIRSSCPARAYPWACRSPGMDSGLCPASGAAVTVSTTRPGSESAAVTPVGEQVHGPALGGNEIRRVEGTYTAQRAPTAAPTARLTASRTGLPQNGEPRYQLPLPAPLPILEAGSRGRCPALETKGSPGSCTSPSSRPTPRGMSSCWG